MIKTIYLLIIALVAVLSHSARAASDVSVVGTHATSLGPITLDISVAGVHSITSAAEHSATPEVSVKGGWTMTSGAPSETQTICYQVVGGVTMTASAGEVTATNGINPSGYKCVLVYGTGGGVVQMPLQDAATSSPNLAIRVGLPVAISVVGLAAIIGAAFVIMRLRARRAAASQRTWTDRPGGWVQDAPGQLEAGGQKY